MNTWTSNYEGIAQISLKLCTVEGDELDETINKLIAVGNEAVLEYVDGVGRLITHLEDLKAAAECGRARVFVATVPELCD